MHSHYDYTDEVAELRSVGLTTQVRIGSTAGTNTSAAKVTLLIAHGLGAGNPKSKTHLLDSWVDLIGEGELLSKPNASFISYTARGHGDSHDWETTASDDLDQFTWRRLSADMIAIADYYTIDSFVASGSSMGSATSLYAAIRNPERVRAVIMVRPPTAGKERAARRKNLLNSAKKIEDSALPGEKFHYVLQGAAMSDLPPLHGCTEEYNKIKCPVLLLTVEGDDAHPVSTAVALHSLLPTSSLHIAPDKESAKRDWPKIISKFLKKLPDFDKSCAKK